MAHLIAFTRARDPAGGWKDGLRAEPAPEPSPRPPDHDDSAGAEARRFYESLVLDAATPPPPPPPPPPPSATPPPPPPRPPAALRERQGHALLRAAQEGDVAALRRLLEREGGDAGFRDAFAWSALMCAARAGRARAVRYLLGRGAQGRREAERLARGAGHRALARLLREWRPPPGDEGRKKGEEEEEEEEEETKAKQPRGDAGAEAEDKREGPARGGDEGTMSGEGEAREEAGSFCPTCGCHFRDPPARHRASTAHLLARGGPPPPPPPAFHIPPSNVGFRLLLRGGWDGRGGLGPAGGGAKTPPKTLLKRDHRGLGCPGGPRPRVTHFGPRDAAAVAEPPRAGGGARGGAPKARGGRSEEAERAWERRLRAYMAR